MELFTQYIIEDSDSFNEDRYPRVADEINDLQQSLLEFKSLHKAPIVISLLKDHSIDSRWLNDDRQLAGRLTSGTLQTSHLESLFNACKGRAKFLHELEAYIFNK